MYTILRVRGTPFGPQNRADKQLVQVVLEVVHRSMETLHFTLKIKHFLEGAPQKPCLPNFGNQILVPGAENFRRYRDRGPFKLAGGDFKNVASKIIFSSKHLIFFRKIFFFEKSDFF